MPILRFSSTYAYMIRPRASKFGVVTHMGKGCFRQTAKPLHLHKSVARFVSVSWFLPRDAMSKCGLCCGMRFAVRLSVRPSRWCIVSRRLKLSSNLFVGPVAASFYSFLIPSAGTQFQRQPLQRGRKIQGVGKFCDFRLKSPSISETVWDTPMVAMKS